MTTTNSKKPKIIILSITLSLAFIFILVGCLVTFLGKKGTIDKPYKLEVGTVKTINKVEPYEYTYCSFKTSGSYDYYIYVSGASLSALSLNNRNEYPTIYSYGTYHNGYYYDYCYHVSDLRYNSTYTLKLYSTTSEKINIIISTY